MDKKTGPEIHTILLWEAALPHFDNIAQRLRERGYDPVFIRGNIPAESQIQFVARFYFQSRSDFAAKVARVGASQIMFGAFRDNDPQYGVVNTSRGKRIVNTNTFYLKSALRKLVSPDDAVHVSDSRTEAFHNGRIALGANIETFSDHLQDLSQMTLAPNAPASLAEIFSLLNRSLPYVVLRNFEEVYRDTEANSHGDIDLLVESREEAVNLLGARPATHDKTRRLYWVAAGTSEKLLDIRTPGENYYDRKWCLDILARRIYSEDHGFYIPSPIDLFYSLAYHALIHKHTFSDEYRAKLISLEESLTGLRVDNLDEGALRIEVDKFCLQNDYQTVFSGDKTVKFNPFTAVGMNSFRNIDVTRTTPIPEHHARALIDKWTADDMLRIYAKQGSASNTEVYVSDRNHPRLLLKRVQAVDPLAAPFLYHEHEHLQKMGGCKCPRLLFFGIHAGWYVQIMEFVAGWTLDNVKLQISTDSDITSVIARLNSEIDQIEAALLERNIRHRDIRPANFIINKALEIFIIDFGLAASTFDADPYLPPRAEVKVPENQAFQHLKAFIASNAIQQ